MQGYLTMSNIELDRLQVLQKIMERRMTLTQYGRALHELGIEIICQYGGGQTRGLIASWRPITPGFPGRRDYPSIFISH
jgi:hypothetical protein